MKATLHHLREKLRSSFWFVPGCFAVGAIVAARLFLEVDASIQGRVEEWMPGLSSTSPAGLRSLLSTIASSVLTLAGLAFSATLVALSLASSQFGPRLLRNFIRSRTNQVTFGILTGNFLFCLVVLRFVSDEFLPHLSALLAFLFGIVALGAFIVFVHSIISSLQADRVVAEVYKELENAVESFFPDALPSGKEEREAEQKKDRWEEIEGESCLESSKSGYLEAINVDDLVEIASRLDGHLRIVKRPGHFVHTGEDLVAYEAGTEIDDAAREKIFSCLLIGPVRTAEQDFEFFVRQLVEVALRALSPGINDPFTAITCIDFLSEAMARIAQRRLPQRIFNDEDGITRVVLRPVSFQGLLGTAFLQLRQNGGDKPDIVIALLEGMLAVATTASTGEQKEAILEHAETVADLAIDQFPSEYDRSCVEQKRNLIREKCGPQS